MFTKMDCNLELPPQPSYRQAHPPFPRLWQKMLVSCHPRPISAEMGRGWQRMAVLCHKPGGRAAAVPCHTKPRTLAHNTHSLPRQVAQTPGRNVRADSYASLVSTLCRVEVNVRTSVIDRHLWKKYRSRHLCRALPRISQNILHRHLHSVWRHPPLPSAIRLRRYLFIHYI